VLTFGSVGIAAPAAPVRSRDLFSAYLARFVHPDTSLLDAGQAKADWPVWDPTRAAGVREGHSEPTRRAAGVCLSPLVGLRLIRDRGTRVAQSIHSSVEVQPTRREQRKGHGSNTPEPALREPGEWLRLGRVCLLPEGTSSAPLRVLLALLPLFDRYSVSLKPRGARADVSRQLAASRGWALHTARTCRFSM
jgi:hypothetical protein